MASTTGGEKIAHSTTIRGKLSQAAKSATEAAGKVPTAPVSGMRPEHAALLNNMFKETRKTLGDIAATAQKGVDYLSTSDRHEDKSAKKVADTPIPEYGEK